MKNPTPKKYVSPINPTGAYELNFNLFVCSSFSLYPSILEINGEKTRSLYLGSNVTFLPSNFLSERLKFHPLENAVAAILGNNIAALLIPRVEEMK